MAQLRRAVAVGAEQEAPLGIGDGEFGAVLAFAVGEIGPGGGGPVSARRCGKSGIEQGFQSKKRTDGWSEAQVTG